MRWCKTGLCFPGHDSCAPALSKGCSNGKMPVDAIRLGHPLLLGTGWPWLPGDVPLTQPCSGGCKVPDAAQPRPPHTALTSLAALPLPTLILLLLISVGTTITNFFVISILFLHQNVKH